MVISAGVHPHWRQVARTFARGTGHEIVEVPLRDGVTDWDSVGRSRVRPRSSRPTPTTSACSRTSSVAKSLARRERGAVRGRRRPRRGGRLEDGGPVGRRRLRRRGSGLWHAALLRRALPRAVRLHRGPGASPARAHRRRDGRLGRPARLRHDPARARAGHPPREGHVERLHQPDPHGGHRRRSSSAGSARRACARSRRAARRARTTSTTELVAHPTVSSRSPSQPFFREFARAPRPRPADDVIERMAERRRARRVSPSGALVPAPDPSIEGDIDDVLLVDA